MTIKNRFLISYLSAFVISIGSLLLILSLVFYLSLNKIPSITDIYKTITKQRALTPEEEESYIALDRLVKKSPDLLTLPFNEDLLTTIRSIEEKGLDVVIRKNDQFPYFSTDLVKKSLIAHAPDYEINNFTPAGTLDNAGRLYHYIKLDFKYLDGSSGSFIILKRESNLFEFFTKWGIWVILAIIVIAILSAWLINHRLTKTTIRPLEELEVATKSMDNFSHFISKQQDKPTYTTPEVKQLQHSFQQMWHDLQRAETERNHYEDNRKELLANISHDLKTPITSIIGHVEGLLDGVANTKEKQGRYLEIIHKQGITLNELIEELFLYSKLDLDAVIFNKEQLDFIPYVRHVLEDYHWEKEISITTDFPDTALPVLIDPIQMTKVMTNLIQNSLKFRDPRKEQLNLDFHLTYDSDCLYLSLIDNGMGIAEEELNHIFRRFYRVDKSRTPTVKGSGLGLSIVKQIIEHHEGTIHITSQVGVRTDITIALPLTKEVYHDKKNLNY